MDRTAATRQAWRAEYGSEWAYYVAAALVFAASVAGTIACWVSMSGMDGMPMPGDWTMSMMWMRMPGQTWPAAVASFLVMWMVMMVAMMLPSLVPMLTRYRQAIRGTSRARRAALTGCVATAYFLVWAAFGMVAYPLGLALASATMESAALSHAVPVATALVVLAAGALQFTTWKARQLACCRQAPGPGRTLCADTRTAWRHGLRLGLHCARCCGSLMAALLVVGMMDLAAMAIVTAAITAERLAPAGERVSRAVGVLTVMAGLVLIWAR